MIRLLDLTIEFQKEKPLYLQIYEKLKNDSLNGKLSPGTRLPSKRKLAASLGVSINTVDAGYQQLAAEGYIEAVPRKGWYTLAAEKTFLFEETAEASPLKSEPVQEKKLITFDQTIDASLFPVKDWRKNYLHALSREDLYHSGNGKAEPELAQEIVKHLYHARGVKCRPEQIFVGAGTQVLMERLTILLGKRTYAMENPGYHRMNEILKNDLCYIPLDEAGLRTDILAKTDASAVYITPSHQFPLGMIMPAARRIELLNWAYEGEDRYIIEDDYDGEYRYEGKPIPALQGLDEGGKVIYMGTFSKSLLPSLRISFMILPENLLPALDQLAIAYKQTVSRLDQIALAGFMASGAWERHLNRMRTHYRKKRSVLLSAMARHLPETAVIGEKSGLHIIAAVGNGLSEQECIMRAKQKGVAVFPVSLYHHTPYEGAPLLLLGFGRLSAEEIEEGILLLKDAWY
ncbi:PLP-dependent aminotransferase family protein [Metabacillus sp. GX 13764]|uniref:MocR-like pyridoxine biosynthesis transcription factor PdxR n=1 Tax=Metabacillus kandeliae TaxID=2900151 RepID=UPI001E3827AD|nr:PLP-dependent aminotransferase family protein [Metabacillus kandeliae]MCD7034780.1 PLP-dependent aminotransferase family protein [Metabacillus kandeliae]